MARTKKTEKQEPVAVKIDYGTGRTRINNMLQAGVKISDIKMEDKRNE